MRRTSTPAIVLVASVLVFNSIAIAQPKKKRAERWDPQRTCAFIVGVLEFKDPKYRPYPKENRRDEMFVNALRERGVRENRIRFIKDAEATTRSVHDAFLDFLTRTGKDDWIIVYYTGHGGHTPDHKTSELASYDTGPGSPGLEAGAIPNLLEQHFQGSHAIIAIDCCCSGAVVENIKSLKRSHLSYAALSSAHFNSSSTDNWTFTENLLYAFRGDNFMDDDGNGVVTFLELRNNIVADMTFAESQMPASVFTGNFDRETVIARTNQPADPDIGQRAEFLSAGDWYRGFTVAKDGEKRKVHYYGYDDADDEWVGPDQIRQPEPPKTKPIGTRVEALSGGDWYKATVVQVRGGLHLVKFDDWDSSWNEWLPISCLR